MTAAAGEWNDSLQSGPAGAVPCIPNCRAGRGLVCTGSDRRNCAVQARLCTHGSIACREEECGGRGDEGAPHD